jgi:hypothetical protein
MHKTNKHRHQFATSNHFRKPMFAPGSVDGTATGKFTGPVLTRITKHATTWRNPCNHTTGPAIIQKIRHILR